MPEDQSLPAIYQPMDATSWTVAYKADDPTRMAVYFETRNGVFGFQMPRADAEELAELTRLRAKQAAWAGQQRRA